LGGNGVASNAVAVSVEFVNVGSHNNHAADIGRSVAATAKAINIACDGDARALVAGMQLVSPFGASCANEVIIACKKIKLPVKKSRNAYLPSISR
jgi:hypothetical protein